MLYEAFTFHSQLWLVSEYCHGGSVSTLLKACPDRRLEEQFIIPIARELAIALKYIHEADIVHRDIKCANILIMEDGTLRLADFGVAGIFESNVSKRRTIIGTPHWMPLELVKELGNESPDVQYGTEVDIWAFGCAVYEMATGHGPNQRVRPTELADALRESAPRLEEDGQHSDRLRDFVEYCLQNNPRARPSAAQILEYSYLTATSKRYPTESLQRLVERFYAWEKKGGERKSLFVNVGAALPDNLGEGDPEDEDEWYFSTTLAFEQRLEDEAHDVLYDVINAKADDSTPTGPAKLTPRERRLKAEEGASADRGAKALGAIFDISGAEYKYSDRPEPTRRTSDLPFRNMGSDRVADRLTMIDLDLADTLESVPSLADVSTLKANRPNRFFTDSDEEESDEEEATYPKVKRESNRKTRDWKMPLLSAPADPNFNRRTVDWKFPSMTVTDTDEEDDEKIQNTARKVPADIPGAKRDTMAFSFPMADPSSSMSTESLPLPAMRRPELRSAVTMPMSATGDFQLSSSPDRASMIDLDAALPVLDISRPSTSASNVSFAEYAPRRAPFDLDEQSELSNRTLTVNNNRASLHRQSQSEPNARSSKGSELDDQFDANASEAIHVSSPVLQTVNDFVTSLHLTNLPSQTRFNVHLTHSLAQTTNGTARLFDRLNEMRAYERRRMQTRGSDESVGYSSDGRPRVAGVYQPSGIRRNGVLRSQETPRAHSAHPSLHGRIESENAFEQARVRQEAKGLASKAVGSMYMTRAYYEVGENRKIVRPVKGSSIRARPALRHWKIKAKKRRQAQREQNQREAQRLRRL